MPEITPGCRMAAEEVVEYCFSHGAENRLLTTLKREATAIVARNTQAGELAGLLRGAVALVDSEWLKAMVGLAAAHGLKYSGPILFEVEAARALLAALDAPRLEGDSVADVFLDVFLDGKDRDTRFESAPPLDAEEGGDDEREGAAHEGVDRKWAVAGSLWSRDDSSRP